MSTKQNLAREFQEKKMLVMQKLQELKKQGKGIEEIYKYTNDIIFEEEDEEDDMKEVEESDDGPLSNNEDNNFSQRSKSVNDVRGTINHHQ